MRRWLVLAIAGVALAAPAAAQQETMVKQTPRGVAAGQQPSHLRVFYDNAAGKVVELRPNEALPLQGRSEMQIWLGASDARGRRFARGDVDFDVATGPGCAGRYEITNITWQRFLVRVLRSDALECELYARVVSPVRLERALRVGWGLTSGANYGREEAEYVVDRLYRAILLRSPDREGFFTAVKDVDSGRVRAVVEGLLSSNEFRESHGGWTAERLLGDFYRGLLGRSPSDREESAYRGRLGDVSSRVGVVLDILGSAEFNGLLGRQAGTSNPCVSGGEAAPCELRIYYERGDGRAVALPPGQTLELGADHVTQLWLETLDQNGREFESSALRYRLLTATDCASDLDLHPLSGNRYSVRALDRGAGSCGLVVRLDSPRRIDRALEVAWQGSAYGAGYDTGYTPRYEDEDADYVVDRLYRSLLRRSPAAEERTDGVRLVESGQLQWLVEDLTSSPEFVSQERARSSSGTLQDLYVGLLGRRPAASESAARPSSTADYLQIILQLISSPEFRELLSRQR